MPCYNCTSRVLRIFLQESIAASISRSGPRLQHYRFRQQQQRPSPRTRTQFPTSQRLQSTLASGSTVPPPSDDDYIPFGPPITTTYKRILVGDDDGLSGLLPPPPPPTPIPTPLQASDVVDPYEPEVEILGLPGAGTGSQAREAESKRTIELIRRNIEASWARRGALDRSMAETGLPVVGGVVDVQEDARLAVLRERAARVAESGSDDGVGEGPRGVRGRDSWKLPTMKQAAKREAKRWKEERERATEIERLLLVEERRKEERERAIEDERLLLVEERRKEERERAIEDERLLPIEERRVLKKLRRKEEGKWGALKVGVRNPMERRLESRGGRFLEVKEGKDEPPEVKGREDRGGVKVQKTIVIGHCQIPVPVVHQSLPKPIKARVPSIQEFIRDEQDPFDRKPFSRERAKTRESAGGREQVNQRWQSALHDEVEEGFEWEQKRKRRKWELPPVEEAKKESMTDEWDARQRLQHFVATTPRSELEDWQVQKAALQKKFGMAWAPRKKLSPKARDWVKELHCSVPELTTQKLSEIFRVSPDAIRRILKSKWTPSPEEAQDRERRWRNRQERVWERWTDAGCVQTKGMKAEIRELKAKNKAKWLKEKDEAFRQYLEKVDQAKKERSAVRDRVGGVRGLSDRELFQAEPEPEFSDAGDMMANKVRERQKNEAKWGEWDRKYRGRLERAMSSGASTDPPRKLSAESLAKLSSRFL
ncbi:unnamed protein product [Tuber aestivum]|uniref:Required for respiratory growth protein 9, mitochondrial n=1 Tax=Tuber aestivum TaxID=59557 RepID=A0A292Q0X3_9PEZI|nr:unnamed protein product [Tuber aestivum]